MKAALTSIILSSLAVLAQAGRFQCAGTNGNTLRYEPSGTLTATLTINACKTVKGNIDPQFQLKGNLKCCVTDNFENFKNACEKPKLPAGYPGYLPAAQAC
ncbi:uncharacterized protein CTRU02_212223 [Colletotrichum truncatum]|uniref:Uncharacterized protein n=1 Tax=Colletotrichum truncatum TaxID=5467 RepID=A0ACC3YMY5_COLTU|nr:uncharacterized protein CTRU02_06705 [Colletotrichum truncatum]KAF6792088.1 hypothetical protein CTRU02_06705 [Colletotrichum truncatum]